MEQHGGTGCIYIYNIYISPPAPKHRFVPRGAIQIYIYKIKAVIRGGSQNYIVGVLWDIAIVLIFWCLFRFFMLCSLLCSLLNIELTFSQCSSFLLKSLKNGFWYFKIVEYFLYYLLSHQLPPMNDKPWNGLARIAAPAAKALPAPAATPSGSSKLAVGLLFPGQGSQYAAGQSKELAWDRNNVNDRGS